MRPVSITKLMKTILTVTVVGAIAAITFHAAAQNPPPPPPPPAAGTRGAARPPPPRGGDITGCSGTVTSPGVPVRALRPAPGVMPSPRWAPLACPWRLTRHVPGVPGAPGAMPSPAVSATLSAAGPSPSAARPLQQRAGRFLSIISARAARSCGQS